MKGVSEVNGVFCTRCLTEFRSFRLYEQHGCETGDEK